MIDIQNINSKDPYLEFKKRYENALDCSQENIQSAVISSWNNNLNEVNSRIVNIKYIIDDEWVFFSNYNFLCPGPSVRRSCQKFSLSNLPDDLNYLDF